MRTGNEGGAVKQDAQGLEPSQPKVVGAAAVRASLASASTNAGKYIEPPEVATQIKRGEGAPQEAANQNRHPNRQSQPPENQSMRPVSILITADTNTQIKHLNERCIQLEAYCRDLIKTNKILDMENRLCIAQILNLTNANQGGSKQLDNLVGALNLMKNRGDPVYSGKGIGTTSAAANYKNKSIYKFGLSGS